MEIQITNSPKWLTEMHQDTEIEHIDLNDQNENTSSEDVIDKLDEVYLDLKMRINYELLHEKIRNKKKISGYWGVAPLGAIKVTMLIPLRKIKELIELGFEMSVLIADLHALLAGGADWNVSMSKNINYYSQVVKMILRRMNVTEDRYLIYVGSDLQFERQYVSDLLHLMSFVNVQEAKSAFGGIYGTDGTKVSNLAYPLMQIIDASMLKADVELGDDNQIEIFRLADKYADKTNIKKCTYLCYDRVNCDVLLTDELPQIVEKISIMLPRDIVHCASCLLSKEFTSSLEGCNKIMLVNKVSKELDKLISGFRIEMYKLVKP